MPGLAIESIREGFIQRFERIDKNGDGQISADELPKPRTNRDNAAASDENREGAERRERRRAEAGRPDQQRPRDGGARTRERSLISFLIPRPDSMERLDTDGDGTISQEEMLAPVEVLESLDENEDGTLERSEMASYFQSLREQARNQPPQ